jgi:nitrate/nitrite transporter NarK
MHAIVRATRRTALDTVRAQTDSQGVSDRDRSPSLFVPCLAGAAQSMFFLNHAPVLPLIMNDLGISPAQAGLLSTAAFLGGGVAALPMGVLADRLGPRRVMTLSLLLCLSATLAMALAPGYASLLVVRLCSGPAVTATFIAGGYYVNALWRGRDAFVAQGLYGASLQLGIGGAIVVLPFIADRVGWRGAIAVCAVPIVLASVVWQSAASAPRVPRASGSLRRAVNNANVWRLGLANAAMFGLSVVLGTWIAVYFVHEFRVPLTQAGVLGSLSILLGVVVRPLGGLIVARGITQPRSLVQITLAGNAAALVTMAFPQRPLAAATAGVVLFGITSSLAYAAVITMAGHAEAEAAGAVLAVIGVMSMSAVVIGAPLAGALLSASGTFSLPLAVLTLLPAAALWASTSLRRH